MSGRLLSLILTVSLAVLTLSLRKHNAVHQQSPTLLNPVTNAIILQAISDTESVVLPLLKQVDPQNPGASIPLLESVVSIEKKAALNTTSSILPANLIVTELCGSTNTICQVNLNSQVSLVKEELSNFLKEIAYINKPEVTKRLEEIVKLQLKATDEMAGLLSINCSKPFNLGPTNYQTNLYVTNWRLGTKTYEQVVQDYYQRTMTASNITNCPIEKPFFDGKACISCPDSVPLFDLSTQQCSACQPGFKFNNTLHQCVVMPRSVDYTKLGNFCGLNETSVVPPSADTYPCPTQTPYLSNGSCLACALPKYWNTTNSRCLSCLNDTVFNLNIKQCIVIEMTKLTNLNSSWVAANSTDVLKTQQAIKKSNPSVQVCPPQKPYYDGLACISCPLQFNIDTKLCCAPPAANVYDPKVNSYVTPQAGFETNPNATNILSSEPLKDSARPNCPTSTPYFDGLTCISCPATSPLFNVTSKVCTSCSNDTFYNATTMKCEPKKVLYSIGNTTNLITTSKATLQTYNASVTQATQPSPSVIVKSCPLPKQYSTITQCVTCQQNEYFNVQKLACTICVGVYDPSTSHCAVPTVYQTNLTNSSKILAFPTTLADEKKVVQNQLLTNSAAVECPAATPYTNGTVCFSCPVLFNYTSKTCTSCPSNLVFNVNLNKCVAIIMLTNLTATNIVLASNTTKASLELEQKNLSLTNATNICPSDKPFTADGIACFNCSIPTPLFNYTSKTCVACENGTTFSNSFYACLNIAFISNLTDKSYIQTPNTTLANYTKEQDAAKLNSVVVVCASPTPFATSQGCIACNTTEAPYFNLQAKTCTACPPSTVYTSTSKSCSAVFVMTNWGANLTVIEQANYTTTAVSNQQSAAANASKQPIVYCPLATPYSTTQGCISCPPATPYFNLKTSTCVSCLNGTVYWAANKTCLTPLLIPNFTSIGTKSYVESANNTLAIYQANTMKTVSGPVVECPTDIPFLIAGKCSVCPNNTYFELVSKQCIVCSSYDPKSHICIHYYPNLANTNWVTTDWAPEKVVVDATVLKSAPNAVECPVATPFYSYTTTACVACPRETYFNYQTSQCQTCPTGTLFNINIHKCIKEATNSYQTSLRTPNLVNGGLSSAQLMDEYQANKAKYPNMQDCPPSTPYFDGLACIKCPASAPYFNLKYKLCQNCAIYDETISECSNDIGEPIYSYPNIEKMYSTIF